MALVPNDTMDAVTRHQIYVGRYSTSVANRMIALLNRVDEDLLLLIAKAIEKAGSSLSIERLDRLLASERALLAELYKSVGKELAVDLKVFATHEAAFNVQLLTSATAAANIAVPVAAVDGATVYAAALARPFQGVLLREALAGVEASVAKRVRDTIRMGIVEGQTTQDIVRTIRGTKANKYADGFLERPRRDIETIVRTAISHTSNVARQSTYTLNDDIIELWRFVATLDGKTTLGCASLSGKDFPIGTGPMPPRHYNCLPGDSLVLPRSGVTGAYKRWFDGEMIIIKTASGRELASTPNHPILTRDGWVASGGLNVGGNVVCDGGSEWRGVGDSDHQDMPTSIEHEVSSFFTSREVCPVPVPVATEDFHGDGGGSQVAIVATDGFLRDSVDAALGQHVGQDGFIDRGLAVGPGLIGSRGLDESLVTDDSAGGSNVSRQSELLSLLGAGVLHTHALLFGSIARLYVMLFKHCINTSDGKAGAVVDATNTDACVKHVDDTSLTKSGVGYAAENSGLANTAGRVPPVFTQDASDHLVGNATLDGKLTSSDASIKASNDGGGINPMPAKAAIDVAAFGRAFDSGDADTALASDILSGASCAVFIDEIVSVERIQFSGHVYNLETVGGWYSANGIVTHNCRSTSIPILKGQSKLIGTRASKDGYVAANISFSDWLRNQPMQVQDDILGPVRAGMFRNSKMDVDRFTDPRGNVLTLEELRRKDADLFLLAA